MGYEAHVPSHMGRSPDVELAFRILASSLPDMEEQCVAWPMQGITLKYTRYLYLYVMVQRGSQVALG